jgi:hypothetical protein
MANCLSQMSSIQILSGGASLKNQTDAILTTASTHARWLGQWISLA